MISKELLSEVLNCYVHSLDYRDVLCYKNTIRYWLTPNSQSMPNVINIYELAHKCKEWAFCLDGTMILSSVSEANIGIASIRDDYGNISICEVCESEPEAVFRLVNGY